MTPIPLHTAAVSMGYEGSPANVIANTIGERNAYSGEVKGYIPKS
jgi:hypothetical protein